ncbi:MULTISPECIES: SDR family NAD(P)-dependent oxidoreductase [Enterobacterales]|uniref:SDR family NAD(P)-dependent oxidoreductase n=1 Tax=Enterobacterales TaxID=91347 RepID=UPI00062C9817|nr:MULTISPECIES: SDR family oxidoreductase [Enterobacteriaceae]HDT4647845.1 SDR family oxidoreductase [Citrobacter freundii]KKY69977.1 3-oxoacyl-ACP reductase [Klebsiella michiganensis]MBJ8866076.1 SDR family oxidoreductase [Citrobacter koseri]MBL4562463.1 SDR family oxidoreductase [Citrobacter koseri]MEB2702645.1 SDR family oxidoreductase [Citrobacter koseri]
MSKLIGKVAIITGAGRGIGRATAKLLAAEGAKVAVLSLTSANVNAVVADITAAGGTAIGITCDISDARQIQAAIDEVVTTFGGIDILVNNAFDSSAPFSSILDLSIEQLQRNFDLGPIAYLRTMQAAYPYLKNSGEGRVINFGSMAGVIGLVGYGPYNMAKEAVRALTRTAAREWGTDKITVNNILPVADTWGPDVSVPEPTNPLGRYGSPENDIAPVVLFLASKDSQFITGASLTPDGGSIIDSAR